MGTTAGPGRNDTRGTMFKKTILVVDDEAEVRSILRKLLETEGWRVREAADMNGMMAELDAGGVDLVSLDLELGDGDGLSLARDLRAKQNIPVVIISGHGAPDTRAQGLVAGADDFIVKPFDSREVVIRIHRVLDRYERPKSPAELSIDHARVDLKRGRVVHHDGRSEDLTPFEAKLLELFLKHPEQVMSRDEINRALHGREWSPYDRTIDGHVARLRRKIEPDGDAPRLIRSVRGVGYVFIPENESGTLQP